MPKKYQGPGRTAKKSRKRTAFRPTPPSGTISPSTPRVPTSTLARPTGSLGRSSGVATIRTEDYTYIYNDLRRIAILAAIMFAILIALSFVIK
ncbi:MAG: hypothetical protein FJZ89_04190 [Chloroflexi bacterium]|nr:hypothetical protein [Chloroflexota bacterium]